MATSDSFDNEEFERLSLTDSSYAKVVFNQVKDLYISNEDVNCAFTMMSSTEPSVGDMVALYKVGWSSVEDYIVTQPCHIDSTNSTAEMSVTFLGSLLPKDDGEYYQFCYITVNGEIRGASTPFVFRNSAVDDLFSEEDIENDLLLIQTRTSMLENSLQDAIKDKNNAQIEKQQLQKEIDFLKEKISSFEGIAMNQEETIAQLQEKLVSNESLMVTNENAMKDELSQQNHFINGLRVAVSTLGKEKEEKEKAFTELLLERDTLKEGELKLQRELETLNTVETALRMELNMTQSVVANLKEQTINLEKNIFEKSSFIKKVEKDLQEQISQQNSTLTRLTDTEMMLAAMATSKALAAEELQKHAGKQAQHEAEKRSLVEQCEKYKLLMEQLDKEKIDISTQLKETVTENESLKQENKLLIENQSQLQKQTSELITEVKDLQHRIVLGGEEYKRKYIEWHKLQKKVTKLQQKFKEDKRECGCASTLEHLTNNRDRQSVSSDTRDRSSSSSCNASTETIPMSVAFDDQAPLASEQNSVILNQEQRAKIHAEMENQLLKFHGSKSPPTSPIPPTDAKENEVTTDGHSNSTTTTPLRYPYPKYYPYPYPNEGMNASAYFSAEYSGYQNPYNYLQSSSQAPIGMSDYTNEDSFTFISSPTCPIQIPENPCSPHQNQIPAYYDGLLSARVQEEGPIDARPTCIVCPICNECFPEHTDINEHIDGHLYLKCPVCNDLFDKEQFGIDNFKRHVADHLD